MVVICGVDKQSKRQLSPLSEIPIVACINAAEFVRHTHRRVLASYYVWRSMQKLLIGGCFHCQPQHNMYKRKGYQRASKCGGRTCTAAGAAALEGERISKMTYRCTYLYHNHDSCYYWLSGLPTIRVPGRYMRQPCTVQWLTSQCLRSCSEEQRLEPETQQMNWQAARSASSPMHHAAQPRGLHVKTRDRCASVSRESWATRRPPRTRCSVRSNLPLRHEMSITDSRSTPAARRALQIRTTTLTVPPSWIDELR